MLNVVHYRWSEEFRNNQRTVEQSCKGTIFTRLVTVKPTISIDRFDKLDNASMSSISELPKSVAVLKRALAVLREDFRGVEHSRWLSVGKTFSCRVVCYGDRRMQLMSRSKSANLNLSDTNVAFSTDRKLDRKAIASAKHPRVSKYINEIHTENNQPSTEPFSIITSLESSNAYKYKFNIFEAQRGNFPQVAMESNVFKRPIFLAGLHDGSYTT